MNIYFKQILNRRSLLRFTFLAAGAAGIFPLQNLQAQDAAHTVQLRIDATKNRTPISPFIYGTNSVERITTGSGLTLTRIGGNRMTAYNWENNASNAGSDYQNQSDSFLSKSNVPGEYIRAKVERAFAGDASIIVTVPMAGYVAADKNGGGDVNRSPDFLHTRFRESRPRKGRPFVYPPDTSDNTVYQDEFVAWLEKTFPGAHGKTSQNLFYCLDNEPDLWDHTHSRLRAQQLSYAEMLSRTVEYAAAIKAVAPRAQVFGPVSYGWQGFQTLQNAKDANGRNFLDVYLDGMKQAEQAHGTRLLDVLDIHWYPEAYGGGKRVSESGNTPPALVEARLQAPRSLWDATYKEASWIARDAVRGPVRLLSRLKEQIARHYPGTKLAITEYNYGGGGGISGGIAQADVLGIFGREGLYAATYWPLSGNDSYVYGAFAMFRNFDGKGGKFGDTSVLAETSDTDRVSVYASVDKTDSHRLVVMALNKTSSPLPVDVSLAAPAPYTQALSYQLTSASPAPGPGETLRVRNRHITTTLPPMSVSTWIFGP
jgi:hypothetical protein